MFIKAILTAAVVALASAAATPSEAAARGTCKDVYVKAKNLSGSEIKVIDINYKMKNYGQKSEPVRNTRIGKNKYFKDISDYSKASGRSMRIEVVYRVKEKLFGITKWSNKRRGYSGYAVCKDKKTYTLSLREN